MNDPVSEATCKAVVEILEPLAKLAMETQLFAGSFTALIAQAFVRAIDQEAERLGQPLPDVSTVSARTGLSRRHVHEIRQNTSASASIARTRPSHMLRVLQAWKTDPDFLDEDDGPKILSRRGPISFSALVKRQGGDGLRPGAILKELLRIKAIRLTKEGRVEMLNGTGIDTQRKAQSIRDLGEFGGECLETLVQKVIDPDTPRYYRRVVGLHVKDDEVPRLVRDGSSQGGVWAVAFQDAITDKSVTVKAGASAEKATRLSGHFFISERPSVVPALARTSAVEKPSAKERKRKRG